ncbi:polysaccharide biosynthesis protein [Hippea sp. KM1]|uniref:polysaccharide biosynthesis protein n=1 Tax=Hippea sp. KM1 TaxID=944481 RepID=UPI0004A7CCBF|nr:nucleoside-diphosphate sugar epimerase/dehydratase [Hippea sp. KM1]
MDLLKPTQTKRLIFFLLSDTVFFAFSLYFSLLLRFNFEIPANFISNYFYWLLPTILIKISLLWIFDIYKLNWRFVSIGEFYKIIKGLFIAFFVLYLLNLGAQRFYSALCLPKSSVIIDFLISSFLVLLLRAARRVYFEVINPPKNSNAKNTLIIGAGYTGEKIIREINMTPKTKYKPVAILDDDKEKHNTLIHNVKVVGTLDDIEKAVDRYNIKSAVIAIATLQHNKVKELYDRLSNSGVKDIKIVPSLDKLPNKDVSLKDLKDISIEDLLAREMVIIDTTGIRSFLENKVILVSGAGGSIGSEIVNQLLSYNPKSVIGFEIDETELHSLMLKFKDKPFLPVVGDIRNKEKLLKVFNIYKPQIVFHAAAYKHVPMMEMFPEEAIETNILGTLNLIESSLEAGVEKFINISTDKAVNPKNVMGATKRIAEILCRAYNERGKAKFISVRFGNVLGSRGSAIPLFIEQIKKGGPITITHPDMKRYFMSIPEAVSLVLQAAYMGEGGEVFVLDMGEPIKIVELAERLIKLEGLEPYKDIDIVFTGVRPGEKLFEELLTAEEGVDKTYHEKIYVARIKSDFSNKQIEDIVSEIKEALRGVDKSEIKKVLKKYIPSYDQS